MLTPSTGDGTCRRFRRLGRGRAVRWGHDPNMSKRKHATEVGFKQAVYLHLAGRLAEAEQCSR